MGLAPAVRPAVTLRPERVVAMSLWVLVVAQRAGALTLEEAWKAADANDLELGLARETAIQQGTLRGQAWSALSPRLSASGSYVINERRMAIYPERLLEE